jgi:hypothetical protein
MIYYGRNGQYTGGEAIGILTLESSPVAFIPGDVNNASTYPFPIRYQHVKGFSVQKAIGKDPSIFGSLLEAAQALQVQGVRAITGGCGFMGIHQSRLAKQMAVPVFLSSLIQIPFISTMLGSGAQVGIITADGRNLTNDLLKQVGVFEASNLRIAGLEDRPCFYGFGIQETGCLDVEAVKMEVVETAQKLVADHPGIGALLLECSLLPPYARAVQEAVNLPVFDYVTMIKYVFTAVVQQSYRGFL